MSSNWYTYCPTTNNPLTTPPPQRQAPHELPSTRATPSTYSHPTPPPHQPDRIPGTADARRLADALAHTRVSTGWPRARSRCLSPAFAASIQGLRRASYAISSPASNPEPSSGDRDECKLTVGQLVWVEIDYSVAILSKDNGNDWSELASLDLVFKVVGREARGGPARSRAACEPSPCLRPESARRCSTMLDDECSTTRQGTQMAHKC